MTWHKFWTSWWNNNGNMRTWPYDRMMTWWGTYWNKITTWEHENMRTCNVQKKLRIPAFRFLHISVAVKIHFQKKIQIFSAIFLSFLFFVTKEAHFGVPKRNRVYFVHFVLLTKILEKERLPHPFFLEIILSFPIFKFPSSFPAFWELSLMWLISHYIYSYWTFLLCESSCPHV